jgi:RNA polymerase sigma-70 factor (ECF subfamily)
MRLAVDSPRPDNAAWFAAEVLPHEALLRGWLRARFPALPILDDIVQEAFARVLRAHAEGTVVCPRALLFQTARNLALK